MSTSTMTDSSQYQKGDTIYMLVAPVYIDGIVSDWCYHHHGMALQLHPSTINPGKIVVETKDVIWAARIVKRYKPQKVTFRH